MSESSNENSAQAEVNEADSKADAIAAFFLIMIAVGGLIFFVAT